MRLSVGLLALVMIFAGPLRGFAFTRDDLAGQWVIQFKFGSVPAFQDIVDFHGDGSVTRSANGLALGTFNVTGTAFTFLYTGGTNLNGTVASDGGTISGTATSHPTYGSGTFFASKQGGGTPATMAVELADGTALTSGTSTVDFGTGLTTAAKPAVAPVKLVIKNKGNSPLNIASATVSAGPFHIVTKPGKKIPANGKTTFAVAMTPNGPLNLDGTPATSTTTQTGRLIIYSDDPKTPVFKVNLTGKGGGVTP